MHTRVNLKISQLIQIRPFCHIVHGVAQHYVTGSHLCDKLSDGVMTCVTLGFSGNFLVMVYGFFLPHDDIFLVRLKHSSTQ